MKGFKDLALLLLVTLSISIIIVGMTYNYYLLPVSNNKELKNIIIEDSKDIDKVIEILDKNHLIKNPKVLKFYLTISQINKFKTGKFKLSENMSSKEIINILKR